MKKFVKGMNKDSGRVDQPENTYRDALNANLYYTKGAIVNEEGNVQMSSPFMDVIGNIPLLDGKILIFALVDNVSSIILADTKRNISHTLYVNADLNFQKSHPITGEYRVDAKNDTIVYFTDNYYLQTDDGSSRVQDGPVFNPPRAFNVTRQSDHVIEGDGNPAILYNPDNSFDEKKLNVFPEVGRHSVIKRVDIRSGGALETGAYQLALCYSDENFLETDYFTVCNPVYIFPASEESLPVDSIVGAPAGTPTNKSIKFRIQAFSNNNYTFLQPTIIKTVGGSTTAIKLERTKIVSFDSFTFDIVHTGLEDAVPVPVEDILIDKVRYDTAKGIAQLDNRLYLANLRSRQDIGYQRFACQIKVRPIKKDIEKFDNRVSNITSLNRGYANMIQPFGSMIGQTFKNEQTFSAMSTDANDDGESIETISVVNGAVQQNFFSGIRQHLLHDTEFLGDSTSWSNAININKQVSKGYKNYAFSYKSKTFRRGEVYSFYISFILKDGSETMAYHIPGRAPVCVDPAEARGRHGDGDFRDVAVPEPVCETAVIGSTKTTWSKIEAAFDGFYGQEMADVYGPNIIAAKIADTSISSLVESEVSGGAHPVMGYWQNENELYPANDDFNGKYVGVSGLELGTGGGFDEEAADLRHQPVRHHKMPSNLGQFSYVETGSDISAEGNYNSWRSNQDLVEDPLVGNSVDSKAPLVRENRGVNIVNRDKVRILGVQFDNIQIPKAILSQVRGYKIYYGKRKQEDKTILGQSMVVPAHPRYASVPIQSRLLAKKGPFQKGFYLYGGLTHTDDFAMKVASPNKAYVDQLSGVTTNNRGIFVGNPVFTFYDFNILRKRPDLTGATHVSCQYATLFRTFQGGPGVYAKTADITGGDSLFPSEADDDGNVPVGAQIGSATKVTSFPSLDWVHPDLGNTTNFNSDGEVYDITDRFVDLTDDVANPFGYNTNAPSNRRKKGKQKGIEPDPGEIRATELMVRKWKGQVNIASTYLRPGQAMRSTSVIKGGGFVSDADTFAETIRGNWNWNDEEYDRQNFWNFALDPSSKKYVQGKVNNTIADTNSFHGASIFYNRGGESSLALGLMSGLPHLKGVKPAMGSAGPYDSIMGGTGFPNNNAFDIVRWGRDDKWCFPDACKIPSTRIPSEFYYSVEGNLDNYPNKLPEAVAAAFRGRNYALEPIDRFEGFPASWIVNLNAYKTDVFNPFDKQELVWTGYYKEINPEDVDLDTGKVIDYGIVNNDTASGYNENNYYEGGTSGFVFGGDTYITRYSFRTTSQSYGHTYFRAATGLTDPGAQFTISGTSTVETGDPKNKNAFFQTLGEGNSLGGLGDGNRYRVQTDIPLELDPAELSTLGYTGNMSVFRFKYGTNYNPSGTLPQFLGEGNRSTAIDAILNSVDNFRQGTVDPVATLFSYLCESDDNIGLRHGVDKEKGIDIKFFDKDLAKDVLFDTPLNDHTDQDNLLYNEDYSLLNDRRVARPYPKRRPGDENIFEFATRVIRSKPAGLFIGDKNREFLANDFKDLPKTRGDIWTIFTLNGQLLLHTERSLFLTRGKEELQINAATAFVGSGNIFSQEPSEARETALGFGGTRSILSGVSTPYGRFWVSQKDFKCYMYTGGVEEISFGMETWLRDNMPYQMETLGVNLEQTTIVTDAPTNDIPFGFTCGYDPKYKRILVTKRELIPTESTTTGIENGTIIPVLLTKEFLQDNGLLTAATSLLIGTVMFVGYDDSGQPEGLLDFDDLKHFTPSGWTLSYYPELKVWGSRHSYLPKMYASTPENFYSFNDVGIWEHSNNANPGNFYGTVYPFELDFIDNTQKVVSKHFSSVGYWADIVKKDGTYITEYETRTNPGFTSFYVYNSTQVSGISTNINYLSNARLVDKFWYLNSFRDLSLISSTTNDYINTGAVNVVGQLTDSISTTSETQPMFTSEGVVNPAYVDVDKVWHNRRRFVDHYMGVRLSNDNSSTNLLYLYAAGTKFRASNR